MLIIISYDLSGVTEKIGYDIGVYSIDEATELIPKWLTEDGIKYDAYRVDEILESLI